MYIELIISASFKNTEIIFHDYWVFHFLFNMFYDKYDLLPRYFPLSILVVVYISSKFCLMIIIHSKKRSQFFPRGLYNDISH